MSKSHKTILCDMCNTNYFQAQYDSHLSRCKNRYIAHVRDQYRELVVKHNSQVEDQSKQIEMQIDTINTLKSQIESSHREHSIQLSNYQHLQEIEAMRKNKLIAELSNKEVEIAKLTHDMEKIKTDFEIKQRNAKIEYQKKINEKDCDQNQKLGELKEHYEVQIKKLQSEINNQEDQFAKRFKAELQRLSGAYELKFSELKQHYEQQEKNTKMQHKKISQETATLVDQLTNENVQLKKENSQLAAQINLQLKEASNIELRRTKELQTLRLEFEEEKGALNNLINALRIKIKNQSSTSGELEEQSKEYKMQLDKQKEKYEVELSILRNKIVQRKSGDDKIIQEYKAREEHLLQALETVKRERNEYEDYYHKYKLIEKANDELRMEIKLLNEKSNTTKILQLQEVQNEVLSTMITHESDYYTNTKTFSDWQSTVDN
jgi:hypothetical protein